MAFEQFFRFLRNILLARILAPDAFGLMAIIFSVNSAFETITQISVKEAVIQNPRGHEKTYLNSAWWLSAARASSLYLIVFLCAPWISKFYNNDELTFLLRIGFLTVLFNGFISVEAYVAVKKMNFKKWSIISNGGNALAIVITIVLAYLLKNVWALVIGSVTEALFRLILSFIVCPYRPRLLFDKEDTKTLFKFTRGMFGLPVLFFIWMNADVFTIGKVMTMSDLGMYALAASAARMPFNFIDSFISQLIFPAFSKNQNDKGWINDKIIQISTVISFIGFPLLFAAILYGRDVLELIYGVQYSVVATPFCIIVATALIKGMGVPISTAYLSTGRPEFQRFFTLIRACIMLILIYPAVKWFGLIGAATASLLSLIIANIFQILKLHQITGIKIWEYFRIYIISISLSSSALLIWLLNLAFSFPNAESKLVLAILGCIISYLSISIFFRLTRFQFL